MSSSIDKSIHPDPVPISKIYGDLPLKCLIIFSTKSSVSGLGINVSLLTKKARFQKSFF